MNPTEYYYGKFRDHFNAFWRSLELKGSCSRARAHQRQVFWGQRLSSPISSTLNADGGYFSVGDLIFKPDQSFPNHMGEIPQEDRIEFLCALFYTVLIDQVMYAHHRDDYALFRAITQYPKMDRTIGWARTMMMANPYEIFGESVLESRGLRSQDIGEYFGMWARFIVVDLRQFFEKHAVGTTTWPKVREALISDRDCTWGTHGSVLRRCLVEDQHTSLNEPGSR